MKKILTVVLSVLLGVGAFFSAGVAWGEELPRTNVDPILLQDAPTGNDGNSRAYDLVRDRIIPEERNSNYPSEAHGLVTVDTYPNSSGDLSEPPSLHHQPTRRPCWGE